MINQCRAAAFELPPVSRLHSSRPDIDVMFERVDSLEVLRVSAPPGVTLRRKCRSSANDRDILGRAFDSSCDRPVSCLGAR